MSRLALLLVLAAACRDRAAPIAPAGPAPTPPSPGARLEDERNTIAIFAAASPSTVFVTQTQAVYDYFGRGVQEVPAGSGSGFVWDDRGHIVTNFHVVDGARSLRVTFRDQRTFPAEIVGLAPRVALLLNRGEQSTTYVMPDVIGTDGTRVADALRARGFRVAIVGSQPYPGVPPGTIVRQQPQGGFQVAASDPISLEVSR